jgi:hypothetical protein
MKNWVGILMLTFGVSILIPWWAVFLERKEEAAPVPPPPPPSVATEAQPKKGAKIEKQIEDYQKKQKLDRKNGKDSLTDALTSAGERPVATYSAPVLQKNWTDYIDKIVGWLVSLAGAYVLVKNAHTKANAVQLKIKGDDL